MSTESFFYWLEHNASGRDLAAREQDFFAATMREVRGQTVLQLGSTGFDTLTAAPVDRRLRVGDGPHCQVCCDLRQLPFTDGSIDALSLPHTLEWCAHPQVILHEVHRVLKPEGRLMLSGFNPRGMWFFSRLWDDKTLPLRRHCIRLARLKDWLDLLGFDIIGGQFMVYTPPVGKAERLRQLNFLNLVGNRWLPQYAAAYGLVACKRTLSLRPIKPQWRERSAAMPAGWPASAKSAGKGCCG